MKCLKCESVIIKKGESTMVKGLTYCLCSRCGNVMLLQNGKLTNTPEDDSPATKLMVEDAAKALNLPTSIVSLDGKIPSLEMQLEEMKDHLADFVSDLFEEEEEENEEAEEDVISKMLNDIAKDFEENLSMRNIVEAMNDPKAMSVYNLFKDLNMLEEVEKEIEECNSIEELMEAAIKRAKLVEEKLALLKEDQEEEDEEEMSCDNSFEKLMDTLAKEILGQNEESDDEESDNEETDEYIIIFKDGRYISLKNKTKEEVSEFLNTNKEVDEAEGFRVLRVEDVDMEVSSTVVNTFTLL